MPFDPRGRMGPGGKGAGKGGKGGGTYDLRGVGGGRIDGPPELVELFPNQHRQPGKGIIKLEGKTMLMRKKDPNRHVEFRTIQPIEIYFRF